MIDSSLYHRLVPVNRRIQLRRLFVTLALVWSIATLIGLSLWWMKLAEVWYSPFALVILASGTLIATLAGIWIALRNDDEDLRKTAAVLESKFPELDSSLITAMEQQPATTHGSLGYLQQQVVRKAVYHGYQNRWSRLVPQWQMLIAPVLAGLSFVALLVVMIGQSVAPVPSSLKSSFAFGDKSEPLAGSLGDYGIEPGDVEVERFSSLMVLARFRPDELPAEAELVFWDEDGKESRQSMKRSLDDPVFGTRLSSIKTSLQYAVHFGDKQSDKYKISVFEFPKLERADATLQFPEYTKLDDKILQDVRRVAAVQGTRLTLTFKMNKSIKSGRLLGKDGQEYQLKPIPDDKRRYQVEMLMNQDARLELQLVDAEGRENKSPPSISIRVQGNQLPTIRQVAPAADVEVSPIEELKLTAMFQDDFGVERAGVNYSMAGGEPTEVVMAETIEAKKRKTVDYVLPFEKLNAKPNQLLTFYFWAEDRGPEGELRQVVGDFHLVTVREFESIFRQGQQQPGGAAGQPPGGGQQGGSPAAELADLQRQIVYAIWNLSRREIFSEVSDKFVDDVRVTSQSQETAIQQLDQATEQLPDPKMKEIAAEIRGHQQATVEKLTEVADLQDPRLLEQARKTAEFAYQALLKLRSRENEVVQQQQQQQQQGGQQQNNRSRQQMQQLQLENDENRYQSEQQATEQAESPEDRENRQVLSRLRELARRQNDLNKRIKELQSALEEAETEEEKDDVQEQLKRLQEEQQQILRDTENLQDRMESEQNQSEMSEEADQLEKARENIQESSESLEKGEVSKSAAEGTRALRDLEELRDEFQNRTSGQFNQQMQQMRNEARDIEKEQQDISEQMQPGEETKRPSLSNADGGDEDLEMRLREQQQRVSELRQQIRETIEEAEEFEPLLAERLYDTYRKSAQDSPEEALQSTENSLSRGFRDDANREQRRALENIEKMREGVDNAAEAVLGDETEALRRANRELSRLTNQLEGERDRANPDQQTEDDQRGDRSNRSRDDADQKGEQKGAGDSKSGESDERGERGDEKGKGSDPNDDQPGESEGQGESQRERDGEAKGIQEDSKGEGKASGDQDQEGEPGKGQRPGQSSGEGSDEANDQNQDQPNQNGGRPSLRSNQQTGGRGGNQRNNPQVPRGPLGADPEINFNPETWSDPLTGEDFVEWSDRMRDVEEMVADPELRAEAARIRENARSIRRDIKRHSKEPEWDLVQLKVIEPMVELQNRVQEELIRRSGKKSLVPIDRDPVPAEFEDAVKKYFEQIGRGE